MEEKERSLVDDCGTLSVLTRPAMIMPLLIGIVCWPGLVANSAAQSAAKTIAWRADPQETLRVRMVHRIRTEIRSKQTPSAVSMLTAIELHWKLTDGDEGSDIAIDQTIERLILQSIEADGRTWDFDSASSDPSPPELRELADTIRPLIGSRVSIGLNTRGQIQNVRLAADTDRLLADVAGAERWKHLLTREGMRQMLSQVMGPLPDDPVVLGDRWQEVRTLRTPMGPITLVDRFEYLGTVIEKGRELERISRTTSRQREGSDAGWFDEPLPSETQQDSGTLYFDNVAGRLVRSRSQHRWESEIVADDHRLLVNASGMLDIDIEPLGPR